MAEEKSAEKKQVNLGNWISRAWDMVTVDIGNFIILGLIYVVVIAITSGTVIGELFVIGPLSVGFFFVVFEKIRGKDVNIGDITKGFNYFVAAVLSNILVSFFVIIGFIFCIIPGFIIAALYLFTPAFIVEKNLDFWEAMEASRKLVMNHLFEIVIFALILGLINFVGLLLCGIGVIFTVPLTFAAMGIAYDDLVGIEKSEG
ncbi:hypothetical protein EH223_10385 [candidate division KSB1 bacterium]|nr:hypothetical protein [candidate division KSB1 bacterium]RQW03288.1 MAG: hypothetical protein EH223_10385 [candidate division KSB1 bacterium]